MSVNTNALEALTTSALVFDKSLSVVICTRKGDLEEAALRLGTLMENFSLNHAFGGWKGEVVTEKEPNVEVTCWGPDQYKAKRIVNWAQAHQAEETQESIAFVLRHPDLPGGWLALIIFDDSGQWANLRLLVSELFS